MEFRCNYISNTIKGNSKLTVGKIYNCEYTDVFEIEIKFKDDNGNKETWNINDYRFGMIRVK